MLRLARLFCVPAIALFLVVEADGAAQPEPKAKEKEKTKPNRLAKESSPYLLQHAHNPVDWYPWGTEAFERARKENKLVFLSIGYSSCHWCHVMERESFSNADVARTMNENFVCIKVDREERPDIDDIYMTALNVTGAQGGWPLTMILTSEGKPIFGGTYFPPEDKKVGENTIPGMKTILKAVVDLNKTEHDDLIKQADKLAEATVGALNRNADAIALTRLNRELVDDAANAYEFDPEFGGTGNKSSMFKGAKFPRPPVWSFLLSQSRKPGKDELAKAAANTLRNLTMGGIYDHLGGGFHRYSTERTWTVPHFEKMLYDNAQLVELYSNAYKLNPNPAYKRVVAETLAFVQREMTGPEGGFYSALDADSNHKEGEFYVWSLDEIKTSLGADADFFLGIYGNASPNFEGKHYVLRLSKPLADLAREQKLSEELLLAKLEPLKKKLLDVRSKRERPFLDTKVLCGWNGQMIAGYARAGEVFQNQEYTQAAARAAEFLLTKVKASDGRLLRVWSAVPGGKPSAKGTAFLDDYAYLIHGLLNLHEATGEKKWLDHAQSLANLTITWFADGARGGFFFSPNDGEKLFARSKDSYDGVQPSGNSQMARNLVRLWQKTKNEKYRDECQKTIKVFSLAFRTGATSVATLAQALDEFLDASGTDPLATPGKEDPRKMKESGDMVKASVKLGEPTGKGEVPFTVTLAITDKWHLYANPVGNDMFAEAATEVAVFAGKTKLAASVVYPKGQTISDTDPKIGKYDVYEGTITISGTIPAAKEELEFRIRVNACTEGRCLMQSIVKVKP